MAAITLFSSGLCYLIAKEGAMSEELVQIILLILEFVFRIISLCAE